MVQGPDGDYRRTLCPVATVGKCYGHGSFCSVHIAQRRALTEFLQQLLLIYSVLTTMPHVWAVIHGDENRKIMEDKHMQVILYMLQMCIVPMEMEVVPPTDFVVLHGVY